MSSATNTAKLLASVIHSRPTTRYLRYIVSPEWERRRREHLELCGHWCEICHQRPAIQVHHWSYEHLGREHAHELCAVCVRCHWRIHRNVMHPPAANDNQQLIFTFEDTG